MKKYLSSINILSVIFLICQPYSAYAQVTSDTISQQIRKLEQDIELLKRQQALQDKKDKAIAEKPTNVELGKKGLKITSPDKNYELSLNGYFQLDSRNFLNDNNDTAKNNFIARRLRPVLGFKAGKASFRLIPDFAGSTTRIIDAHADYKVSNVVQFRLGKFKTPVSLERLQSSSDMAFIERGHASNFAPSRDLGFMLYGHLIPDMVEYQLGIFNGNQDLGNTDADDDDDKDIAARLFVHPFHNTDITTLQGLGVGIAGTIGKREGSATKPILGTYKSPGQQDFFRYHSDTFADGQHWRLYPQAYWYSGNVGFLAEYALSNQKVTRGANHAELQHNGWQLAGSYVLTGEDTNFRGSIKPFRDFDPSKSHIGAWEVTARIGQTNIDDKTFTNFADSNIAARKASSYGGGVNWHLNENLKLMANYDFTQFEDGADNSENRPDEHAVFARTQFRF